MLVREAMTAQPRCVRTRESAVDAVATMMTHRFRHLPVLDDEGQVVGLLDIAKCLCARAAPAPLAAHAPRAQRHARRACRPPRHLPPFAARRYDAMAAVDRMQARTLFSPTLACLLDAATVASGGGADGGKKRVRVVEVPAAISVNANVVKAAALMARRRSVRRAPRGTRMPGGAEGSGRRSPHAVVTPRSHRRRCWWRRRGGGAWAS
jgi:hypothetical protein